MIRGVPLYSSIVRRENEEQANTRGPAASSSVHSVTWTSTENLAVLLIVTPVHTPSSILIVQKKDARQITTKRLVRS